MPCFQVVVVVILLVLISLMCMCLCGSEAQVECFSRFVKCMDESVKHLSGTMERSAKKYEECKCNIAMCVNTTCFVTSDLIVIAHQDSVSNDAACSSLHPL